MAHLRHEGCGLAVASRVSNIFKTQARSLRPPVQKRAALIQLTSHAAMSATSVFVAVLAHALGASLTQVGLIVAAYAAAQLVSHTVAGRAADQHGRLRLVRLGLGLSSVAALLHVVAWDPISLTAARLAFGLSAGLYPSALTSLAYDSNRKLGRFTAWGSLGFSVGTLAAGLLAGTGILGGFETSVFVFSAVCLAGAFLASLAIPRRPEPKVEVPFFPRAVIRRNLPAYVAMLLRHVGATAMWAVFPLFLLSLGADLGTVAFVSVVNGVAQFAFMQVADRFASGRLVVAGLVLSTATFVAFALSPAIPWVFAAAVLLGASWAALYTGCLKFVMERNVERATSTGLLQGTLQLANVVGPLVGGVVADHYGFRSVMLIAAALAALAVPTFLVELRRHPAFIEELPASHAHAVKAPNGK